MEKILAGTPIACNPEGYLLKFTDWNQSVGSEIAQSEGIEMTEEHWQVIHYLQEQFRQEEALSIRKIGRSGVVSIKDFYRLFPKGPLKVSSKIAGIPKPASCI
ncbi:MAG: TusE/DsrC/DsvC family sulfur relay protein [Bacteroidia bacterium]